MKKTIQSLLALAVAAFAFTACTDVPEPEGYNRDKGKIVYPPTGTGIATDPYNVAGVIDGTKDLAKGQTTTSDLYTSGYVAKIDEFNSQYGNISFSITDSPEGLYSKTDAFIAYRCLGLDKAKFTSASDLKVGDAVTICGKITNYQGTIEYASGCYLVKLNDKTSGGGGGGQGGDAYINETFASDFGSFTCKTIKGTPWVIDFSTAKATGYDNTSKVTTASESYLVSKTIDLSSSTGAYLEFEYILRYASQGTNKVYATTNYTGDPSTTNWTDITGTLKEGSDWNTFAKYSQNLPAEFIGKSAVVIAFYYACADKSATMEVKNVVLKEGQASDGGESGGGSGGEVVPELTNVGFEEWTDGIPTGWTSKANTATVEKSTDVHGGTASVLVKGDEKYNQRFASQELSLKAGTYVFSYYAKATTADVAQARAGWVPYKDGAPVSSSYKYGNFVSINTTEWTLVSIEFTLNEDSTISVICMNPKVTEGKTSGKDILVDDATLIKK